MTAQKESVVTPERFEQGISYEQWMQQIDRNQDKFVDNYEGTKLNQDEVEAIKRLMQKPNGPAKVVAIGEPWCPDVFRGLGPMAKLAEATGLELKIFFRDQNIDIMNEFLYKGEFQSIPTFVFYDKNFNQLGVWHERAEKAREELRTLAGPITSRMRNQELSQEERDKATAEYAEFQKGPIWGSWRDAEIQEIRELLESAVG